MIRVLVVTMATMIALGGCGDQNSGAGNTATSDRASTGSNEDRAAASSLRPELREIAQLIRDGRGDIARLRLQGILARRPNDGHAYFLFGLTFHLDMRYGQARPHFERAIELAPDYHTVYHFYGYCLYYLGELEAARNAFETHLEFMPDEGDTHFGLGLIDIDENNLDAAEHRFNRAIQLEAREGRFDGVAKSRARLGEVFERTGRLEEAREQLELATDLNPDLYEAFYMLYRVLMRLGDEEAAERALAQHEAARQRVRPDPGAAPGS